ncbi:MAG TPA: TPM domain-containing protein [Candidatus Eisenbacteria bacterium]|nr:TPM domain-containing protein [Candidatus Eisenbacteria bacterium]
MISSSRTIAPTRLLLAAVCVSAFLLPAPAHARAWPKPTGYVNDFAGIIDAASADSMDALIRELSAKTQVEVAVVTIPSLEGEVIDPAAEELYKAWGIGSKEKDEGALILLARDERRVRIEVGYGLEGIIPDGRAGSIIRNVMGPDLRADRFGPGLWRGVQAIAAIVAADRGVTLDRGGPMAVPKAKRSSNSALVLIILFFVLPIVVSWIRSRLRPSDWRTRRRRGWYDPWGGFGGGLGGLGGFGGFGGGGGGGGGFGGFGGGRSGGGGASGGF